MYDDGLDKVGWANWPKEKRRCSAPMAIIPWRIDGSEILACITRRDQKREEKYPDRPLAVNCVKK